jgi:hypothetical protein
MRHFERKTVCANVGLVMVPNSVGEHEENVLSE